MQPFVLYLQYNSVIMNHQDGITEGSKMLNYTTLENGHRFIVGSLVVTNKLTGSVYYVSMENIVIVAYTAKGKKPFIHTRYKTVERMQEVVKSQIAAENQNHEQSIISKQQDKENLEAFRNSIKEGDIFYTSWGYEQTNVEFYQVVSVKGSFCEVREVAKLSYDHNSMSGKVAPKPNVFIGEPVRKKILNGYLKMHSSANASPLEYDVLPTGTKVYKGCYSSSYY